MTVDLSTNLYIERIRDELDSKIERIIKEYRYTLVECDTVEDCRKVFTEFLESLDIIRAEI